MRRVGPRGGVCNSFEDGSVRRDSCKTEVVDDIVGEGSGLVLDPLLDGIIDIGRIPQEVIKRRPRDGEDVWKEGMIAQVRSNGGVVDDGVDLQRPEFGGVTDTRELEDLRSANGTCRQDDFFPGSNGPWGNCTSPVSVQGQFEIIMDIPAEGLGTVPMEGPN